VRSAAENRRGVGTRNGGRPTATSARRPAILLLVGLLGAACAATEVRQGQAGPVAWEVLDKADTEADVSYTIVLRETAGVGIGFTTIETAVPLPPTGYGREYHGGVQEVTFIRRLEPHGELRVDLGPQFRVSQYAELEFRGVDDRNRDVRVRVRVYKR
jgi:hypothetical protein